MTQYFMYFIMLAIFACANIVVFSHNVVRGAFCLALVCVGLSILIICFGATLMGTLLLIVYVGAVAIIFLLSVMMLSAHEKLEPMGIGSIVKNVFICNLMLLVAFLYVNHGFEISNAIPIDTILEYKNLLPGMALYQKFNGQLQLVAVILLASILGAVHITFLHRASSAKIKTVSINHAMSDAVSKNVKLVSGRKS